MVKYWGNQHGHGVVLTGRHAKIVQRAAKEHQKTPQEVLTYIIELAIREYLTPTSKH